MPVKHKEENQESVYVRLLYTLLTCGISTRPALLVITKDQSSVYQAIDKAVRAKHIKEYSVTIKVNNRNHKLTYFGITKHGVNYLSRIDSKLPEEMSWVQAIPWQEKNIDLFGSSRMSARTYRHLRTSVANVFFGAAGAETFPLFVKPPTQDDDDIDDPAEVEIQTEDFELTPFANSDFIYPESDGWEGTPELDPTELSEAILLPEQRKEVADHEFAKPPEKSQRVPLGLILEELFKTFEGTEQNFNGAIKNPGSEIKFYHSRKLSQMFAEKQHQPSVKNTIWGRETGIVESPLKTVLVYTGDKRGMSWSNFHMEIERREYNQFGSVSTYHNVDKMSTPAILLVENPKMFKDLYDDTKGKRRKEPFGNKLGSLLIIPDNRDGVGNAYQYLTTNTDDLNSKIINDAIQSGAFIKRVGRYDRVYPLKTVNGINMAIGVYIDGIQIRMMQEANENLKEPYGVICYGWQSEYYKRVLKDVEIIVIESETAEGN